VRKLLCSLAVVSLAAGCAAGHAAAASPRGTVTGRAQLEGGPISPAGAQPGTLPLPGTVEFEPAGRTHRLVTVAVAVGRSGTFSVRLAPGTYHVVERSPHVRVQLSGGRLGEQPCARPVAVTVVAGHTATVNLTCIVP
jgi:hypothetical protein